MTSQGRDLFTTYATHAARLDARVDAEGGHFEYTL